jgi:hypothetical protein
MEMPDATMLSSKLSRVQRKARPPRAGPKINRTGGKYQPDHAAWEIHPVMQLEAR